MLMLIINNYADIDNYDVDNYINVVDNYDVDNYIDVIDNY